MLFGSFPFILAFLPLSLAGFFVTSRFSHRAAAIWLVLISLTFYAYWRVEFLPVLLISIFFNYISSRVIDLLKDRARLQSLVVFVAIAVDLLALIYFKYAIALAASLGFHSVAGQPFRNIILPLGISFFTFTQIGFLVDVKQGVAQRRDLLSYVLFVTFFPHLIAGPILHHREMMPQFADPNTYRMKSENLAIGITIFILGLAKKVLLADPIASDVATCFDHASTIGVAAAWCGVIGYSLQLYFDFSGYSDMAIGLARMFNIRFPLNFNSPYKATTIIDYWQRFHMTLTRFITMYIFSPLSLRITRWRASRADYNPRKDTASIVGFTNLVIIPTLVTMSLAGVWHGAGSQYLVFGLLHGFYIVINHARRVFFPKPKKVALLSWQHRAIDQVWKVLAVYLSALVASVFFRSPSTSTAISFLSGMVGLHRLLGLYYDNGTMVPLGLPTHLLFLLVIVWGAPNVPQIMNKFEPALGRALPNPLGFGTWMPTLGWGVLCGVILIFCMMALGVPTEFLYFQF